MERIEQLRQQLNQVRGVNAEANEMPAPPAPSPVPVVRPHTPPRRGMAQAAGERVIVEGANNRDRNRVAVELARADAGRVANANNANGGAGPLGDDAAFDAFMGDFFGDGVEYEDDFIDEDMADWLVENEGVGGGRALGNDWL